MDRLRHDPALEICPDYDDDLFRTIRTALIADPTLEDITNDEQAIQHLKDIDQEEQRRQQEEENCRLQQEEERKKEEERRKEKEKSRTPLLTIPTTQGIQCLRDKLHPFAKKKIASWKYFALWYCLPEAAQEATKYEKSLTEDTGLSLVKNHDATFAVKSIDTAKPSPNAKPDEALSWQEIMRAKTVFLTNLHVGEYPPDHVQMFSQFYVNMELHPLIRTTRGEKTFARYHAKVRWDWYETNEAGNPYNLSIINEEILRECSLEIDTEELEDTILRARQATANLELQKSSFLNAGKTHSRATSVSKRPPPDANPDPPPSYSPKKARTGPWKQLFRAADLAIKLSRCPLCLSDKEHNIRECNRDTMWDDKTPTQCKRNARKHLENPQGIEICTNWQTKNSCTNTHHPHMHECSGCGDPHHGAQACP
ncbi:hypothetical protein VKT23_010715 [Stygiomarasmius scandens]|uniref:Uncharacterized protein n=1 Tax=Marasmiellus scandens TaxID=2682957 RepID=A0ABR1JC04_9AGAR